MLDVRSLRVAAIHAPLSITSHLKQGIEGNFERFVLTRAVPFLLNVERLFCKFRVRVFLLREQLASLCLRKGLSANFPHGLGSFVVMNEKFQLLETLLFSRVELARPTADGNQTGILRSRLNRNR